MSKLVKRTAKQRELAEAIEKVLKDWNFQHAVRHCYTPKYGDGAYVIENWSLEDVADLIVDEAVSQKERIKL